MPLVLMQRAWRDDPKYKDTEFCVYHYPRAYFDRINGRRTIRLLPTVQRCESGGGQRAFWLR